MFNAIPWVLTGVLIFAIIFFAVRWFLVNSIGARLTPNMGRQVAIGSIIAAILVSVVTWPVYENGFWDYGGLGAMDDIEELEKLRGQPMDVLIEYDAGDRGDAWDRYGKYCVAFDQSNHLEAWSELPDGDDPNEWCVMPASEFLAWGLYQPTQKYLVDFGNANGHIDPENELNGAYHSDTYVGTAAGASYTYNNNQTFFVENLGLDEVVTTSAVLSELPFGEQACTPSL